MSCEHYCRDGSCRYFGIRCPDEDCEPGFLQCDRDTLQCYYEKNRCDGIWDCRNGEDETGCSYTTPPHRYRPTLKPYSEQAPEYSSETYTSGVSAALSIGIIIPIIIFILVVVIIICCICRRQNRFTTHQSHIVTAGVPPPIHAGAPPQAGVQPSAPPTTSSYNIQQYPTQTIASGYPQQQMNTLETSGTDAPPSYNEAISIPMPNKY